jgi:hypothetical protein
MKTTVVRYQAKPERAAENQQLIEAVFADLEEREPEGFTYKVFRLEPSRTTDLQGTPGRRIGAPHHGPLGRLRTRRGSLRTGQASHFRAPRPRPDASRRRRTSRSDDWPWGGA